MIEIQVEGTCGRCSNAPAELVLLRTSEDGDDEAMCLACFRKLLGMAEKLEVIQKLQGLDPIDRFLAEERLKT